MTIYCSLLTLATAAAGPCCYFPHPTGADCPVSDLSSLPPYEKFISSDVKLADAEGNKEDHESRRRCEERAARVKRAQKEDQRHYNRLQRAASSAKGTKSALAFFQLPASGYDSKAAGDAFWSRSGDEALS